MRNRRDTQAQWYVEKLTHAGQTQVLYMQHTHHSEVGLHKQEAHGVYHKSFGKDRGLTQLTTVVHKDHTETRTSPRRGGRQVMCSKHTS